MTTEDPYYNRRAKGTKFRAFRHRVSLAVLAVSGLIGIGFHYLPHSQVLVQKIKDGALDDDEAIISRKVLMLESLTRSSASIRKEIKDREEGNIP